MTSIAAIQTCGIASRPAFRAPARAGLSWLGAVAAAAIIAWGGVTVVGIGGLGLRLAPVAPARLGLSLRLPVVPGSLVKEPVRPGRFERLPAIATVGAAGLDAVAVAASRRRLETRALAEAMTGVLGRAADGALAMALDLGAGYSAYMEERALAIAANGAAGERTVVALAEPAVEAAVEAEAPPPIPFMRPASLPRLAVEKAASDRPAAAKAPAPEKPKAPTELAMAAPRVVRPERMAPPPAASAPTALPGRRSGVAVYDISAGVVYMPGGERLEAHSGIGPMRDNPRFVHVKMRGATPPATYRLTLRESLFHGVQAIRLTPVDGNAPHGRVGLLAHTYMLRAPGDSNGCVVFRDYGRFLAAFMRGEVRQMIVVPSMAAARAQQMASLD